MNLEQRIKSDRATLIKTAELLEREEQLKKEQEQDEAVHQAMVAEGLKLEWE